MKIKNIKNYKNMVAIDVETIGDEEWTAIFKAAKATKCLLPFALDLLEKNISLDVGFVIDLPSILYNADVDFIDHCYDFEDLDPIEKEDIKRLGERSYSLEVEDLGFEVIVNEYYDLEDETFLPKDAKIEII